MTRRNEKRNNRRNRQRSNKTELAPFSQMLLGALLGKGVEMIAKKMAEKETPDIHAEGITNKDINNINNGNATLSKLRIPADGSAVEYPIPDGLSFFFNEEGKLMVHKKPKDDTVPETITYDDICKELFLGKNIYWVNGEKVEKVDSSNANYKDYDNCTSIAQAKRFTAFNKLQNIAKFLNDGWKPNFNGNQKNWNIIKDDDTFVVMFTTTSNKSCVYFKSEELAKEAIRIMGEDSLNDLFSTDW